MITKNNYRKNNMSRLPEVGYVRLKQILGDKKSNPPIAPIIPISSTTWWEGVKSGKFPQPIKFGPRITVWRVEDIRELIENGVKN